MLHTEESHEKKFVNLQSDESIGCSNYEQMSLSLLVTRQVSMRFDGSSKKYIQGDIFSESQFQGLRQ
jgi:hypothetical protein